ncbi:hypothetical protein HOLleu_12953 [Holothuria leucospilota]|uniref:Uncharacterized protein n=1 Tax=Holothuria leucospilota TaxID=206669 RepID=A0A9Q1CAZ0_HOLLE|nr:hypothetical protein HOLleu_12953 [Holothuria leucospilota]
MKKMLFLVATASARRSCLHALTVKVRKKGSESGGVRLVPGPTFLPKNQSINFFLTKSSCLQWTRSLLSLRTGWCAL